MQVDQFHQLLDEFKSLSLSSTIKPPTLMEIAGYPHYENVCSNILAFYFQPDAPHGLSDLCLKALLSLVSDDEQQSNVTVEREVITQAGKRIDILIRSDTHLIAIENKIYHSTEPTPFNEYASFVQQQRAHRKGVMFLLSLYPEGDHDLHGFIPIRYKALFSKLRPLIGNYIARANTKFLISFTDFMETIDNLRKGSAMDQGIINLLDERGSEISSLIEEVSKFKAEMRKKVSELGGVIDFQSKPRQIKQCYYREQAKLYDILVHDIYLADDFVIRVNCVLSPKGWRIVAYDQKGDLERARSLFNRLQIPLKEGLNDGKQLEHLTIYHYNEQPATIQAVAQNWIDRVAVAQDL